jgi:hypothetical protein
LTRAGGIRDIRTYQFGTSWYFALAAPVDTADTIPSNAKGTSDRCTKRAGDSDYHVKRRTHEIIVP